MIFTIHYYTIFFLDKNREIFCSNYMCINVAQDIYLYIIWQEQRNSQKLFYLLLTIILLLSIFRRTLPIPGRLPRGGSAVQTKGPTPISKTRISNKKPIARMNNGSLLMTPMSVHHNHKPIGPIGCVTCCRLLAAWPCLYSSFSLVAGSSLDNPKREIGKMIKMEREDTRSKRETIFPFADLWEALGSKLWLRTFHWIFPPPQARWLSNPSIYSIHTFEKGCDIKMWLHTTE